MLAERHKTAVSPDRQSSARSPTNAAGLEPVSDREDVIAQTNCEDCFETDQMRAQYRDLCTMYQSLCEAYNQSRRELDDQCHEIQSLNMALTVEKSNRLQSESRCQTLQHAFNTVEASKCQSESQQMIIISKLTDILYALPTGVKGQ